MSIVLNIPEWAFWVFMVLLAISTTVNVWYGRTLRRYHKALEDRYR